MIKISNKVYLEDRKTSTKHPQQIHNIQGVDYTFGARLCSNGEVDNLLYQELFFVANQDLQHIVVFHTMTSFRSLFSRRLGGSPRENQLETQSQTGRETRTGMGGVGLYNSCTLWSWIPRDGTSKGCSPMYSTKPPLLTNNYQKSHFNKNQ